MNGILGFIKELFPASCHKRIVLVGGTVRDMLLGEPCSDIDLVAALSDDELSSIGFHLVEASSGADIWFRYDQNFGKIEITLVDVMELLDCDLRRRDFTVNAIAMDLDGAVIDPLNGSADLEVRLLRACSADTFVNDPLRIFRAFRFECGGWRMVQETEELIQQQDWSVRFATMPVERFSNEMLKALVSEIPERFFGRMIEFRVGAEFLPELFLMPAIPAGPLEHHPEGDLLTHSIQVLQRVAAQSDDTLARFCAFFHDIGKLATDPDLYPKHHGHDDAGFYMAENFCNRLRLPVNYRKALAWISRLHGKANKWEELRDATKVKMAEQAIKEGIIEILPLVSAADKPGNKTPDGWQQVVYVAGMNTQELRIDIEKLETMTVEDRVSYILQKRIDALRLKYK